MIDPELKAHLDRMEDRLNTRFAALEHLVDNVNQSLGREIADVKATVKLFDARLNKIAAGTHYVTRLVEWSEKQDDFAKDILDRMQALEARVIELEKRNGSKR